MSEYVVNELKTRSKRGLKESRKHTCYQRVSFHCRISVYYKNNGPAKNPWRIIFLRLILETFNVLSFSGIEISFIQLVVSSFLNDVFVISRKH